MASFERLSQATTAINNVLQGRSADGTRAITASLSFPKKTSYMPALTLARVLARLDRELDAEDLTILTVKLLSHLTRQPCGPFEACWQLDITALQHALNTRPTILRSRASIAAMLRAAAQHEAVAAKRRHLAEIQPRALIANLDDYTLTEVTDPEHLRQDGRAIGHCAGVHFDEHYLHAFSPRLTGRDRLMGLTYWRRIVLGQLRIFSLIHKGRPVATIGYNNNMQSICELAVINSQPLSTHPLLPTLCQALMTLSQYMPVRQIRLLPESLLPDHAVSIDGTFIRLLPANAHLILADTVRLPDHTSLAELDAWAVNPRLTLDITAVCPRVLDRLVSTAGSLQSRAPRIVLNALRHVGGDLACRHGSLLEARNLETIGGTLNCFNIREIRQDNLRRIGLNNLCEKASLVYQPRLRTVGGISVCSEVSTCHRTRLPETSRPFSGQDDWWRHTLQRIRRAFR